MKSAIKLALLGASLVAGSAFGANVVTPTGANSDLVLFVTDTTAKDYYVFDTGVTLNSVLTTVQAGVDQSALPGYGQFPTTPTSIAGGTNLAAFLAGTLVAGQASTDSFSWSIMGADSATTGAAGASRILYSSATDPGISAPPTPSNLLVQNATSGMNSWFSEINGAGNFTSNVSTTVGLGTGTYGKYAAGQAGQAFFGSTSFLVSGTFTNAAKSTAETLYALAASDATAGGTANGFYSTSAYYLSANGVSTTQGGGGSPVPVPGAVWLLGSGLLGLVGVSRRRVAA